MRIALQILRQPAYISLILGVATLTVVFTVLVPNFGLIGQIISGEGLVAGLTLAMSLFLSIGTNLTTESIAITVALGLLLGLNLSFLIHKIRQARQFGAGAVATSGVGFFVGLLGVGCAACGTALVSAILPFVGIGGALAVLPFNGIELQFVALALLIFTLWRLVRDLSRPQVCAMPLAKAE